MCGIVGIVAVDEKPVEPASLQRMSELVAHRGPDGAGHLLASGDWAQLRYRYSERVEALGSSSFVRLGLGHRRLAIIDLSDRGLQPMSAADGRTWIVFNGEIYNYRELRRELEVEGFDFRTRTDTEVLLNAYLHWGESCVERLQGMFAFAIWNGLHSHLFCARDRLGIKPFYYAMADGHFLFASEIKALLGFPACPREADDQAVTGFLTHGNCDYAERTLFRGIRSLPAAHTLTLDTDGHTSIKRYWSLASPPLLQRTSSDRDHLVQLRETLLATVRSHLISDVRVGSCLSGGLDSSAVVGGIGHVAREQPNAAQSVGEQLRTFTSCYADKSFDERDYALAVAQSVGADPHLVFPSPVDFWTDFERLAWHQDMPFGSLSFYAQWRVMRAARDAGVKVLVDGQGGDEIFGGYAKFRYAYLASLLRSRRWHTAAKEMLCTVRQGDRYSLDIRNGYRYLPAPVRRALHLDSALRGVVTWNWDRTVADDASPGTRWWRYALRHRNGDPLTLMQRIQADDIALDTLPQLLRMEDRSSMAFSLEARVPLLDHKLVQLGLALPDHLKVRDGWSKVALRLATEGFVPDAVRWRKTKLGFAAPDRMWLTEDLRQPITDLLAGSLRAARYLDPVRLRRWYDASKSARPTTETVLGLFRVLSLEMWMRAYAL